MIRQDDNDLIKVSEGSDELRDVPAAPDSSASAPEMSTLKRAAHLKASRIASSFAILAGLLVAKIFFSATLTRGRSSPSSGVGSIQ